MRIECSTEASLCGLAPCAGRKASSNMCKVNGNKTEKVGLIESNELGELSLYQPDNTKFRSISLQTE